MLENLVEIRRNSGLKQEDVAELLGITQQAVSKFEAMDSSPSLARVRHYAHAVGALVAHVVVKDSGQLESYGNDWLQVTFAENKSAWDVSVMHAAKWFSVKSSSTEICVNTPIDITAWIAHHDVSRHGGSTSNFEATRAGAAASKRTDFALGA